MTSSNAETSALPEGFVSIPELVRRSSLSRATIYNLVASGELPKPSKLTKRRVGFPVAVARAFLTSRLEAA